MFSAVISTFPDVAVISMYFKINVIEIFFDAHCGQMGVAHFKLAIYFLSLNINATSHDPD